MCSILNYAVKEEFLMSSSCAAGLRKPPYRRWQQDRSGSSSPGEPLLTSGIMLGMTMKIKDDDLSQIMMMMTPNNK